MFSMLPKVKLNFEWTFILSSAIALNYDKSAVVSLGKELKHI